jgi:hypothetical protein
MTSRLPHIAAVALAVLALTACSVGKSTPSTPPEPPGAAGTRAALLVIGDSLSVATAPILPRLLPGWTVYTDGVGGRPTAVGMAELANTNVPPDGSTVLAFSLFTNDDPTHPEVLRDAVQTSLDRAGPRGCVVWATIVRPPAYGTTYDAVNAMLGQIAGSEPQRMRLVDWAGAVRRDPSLLGPDKIHPTPRGAQVRAQLYARAAKSCGPAPAA